MANKIYVATETAVVFQDSGGNEPITLANLAAGAGRLSDRYDRGTGSKARLHKWRAKFAFETAPVVGEYVDVFLAESDGTTADGNVGASDAALTSGQKSNLSHIGTVKVQTTDADTGFVASGYCLISERYYSIGVWNATADNLQNDANASSISIIPVPDEVQ